jgi:hypothetical protein
MVESMLRFLRFVTLFGVAAALGATAFSTTGYWAAVFGGCAAAAGWLAIA